MAFELGSTKRWTEHEARTHMDRYGNNLARSDVWQGVSEINRDYMLKLHNGWTTQQVRESDPNWVAQNAKNKASPRHEKQFEELDNLQTKQYRDLTRDFNRSSELRAASQTRGMMTRARQGLGAAGLEGPMAEAMMLREQGKLAEATTLEQSSFKSKLLEIQGGVQNQFKLESFSFLNALDMAERQAKIQRSIIAFQDRLAQDRESRGMFFDMLGGIGNLIGKGLTWFGNNKWGDGSDDGSVATDPIGDGQDGSIQY